MTHHHNSKPHFCPCCGQRVLMRRGVLLSPRQADVFDVIAHHSKRGGIRIDVLFTMFEGGNGGCIKVHICNINKKLATKGWRIVCEREGNAKGFYRIRRNRNGKVSRNAAVDRRISWGHDAPHYG